MKKLMMLGTVLFLSAFFAANVAYSADQDKDFEDLKPQLQSSGLSATDIRDIEKPVKDMLKRGVNKDDLSYTINELARNDIKGSDLTKILKTMDDRHGKGNPYGEINAIVTQTVTHGQSEGLKGRALADRVNQSVKSMQDTASRSMGTGEMGAQRNNTMRDNTPRGGSYY